MASLDRLSLPKGEGRVRVCCTDDPYDLLTSFLSFAKRRGESKHTYRRSDALWFRFVQIVERIIQRHTPYAAEAGFRAKLVHFRFMETERAKPRAIVRQ